MCSVVWFIKVTRPLGLKGGGVGAAHAARGGVQRNLAFVVRLSLCPESGSIEEGEGKPTSSCIQDEPQLHSSSFPLLCPLEEGMATHSSILAWRISWMEEPGGLQSMVLHALFA